MEALYAQALLNVAKRDGTDVHILLKTLSAKLQEQGRLKVLPGIMRALKRLDAQQEKMAPRVEVAQEKDSESALQEAATHGITAERAIINPSLISGWRATGNGKLVDRSGKKALVELYQNIAT